MIITIMKFQMKTKMGTMMNILNKIMKKEKRFNMKKLKEKKEKNNHMKK